MGSNKPKKPLALSIDFDFFVYENPAWGLIHSESSCCREPDGWDRQLEVASRLGIDLTEVVGVARADVHPLQMLGVLEAAGWYLHEDCQFTVSDSHMYAAEAFYPLANCRIVNFDAHHDLGYLDRLGMQKRLAYASCNCEDWLWVLLQLRNTYDSVQIYPTWCPRDWPECPHWIDTELETRVRASWYSREVLRELAGPVIAVHLARSSAWVPPWCDSAVVATITQLEQQLGPACNLESRFNPKRPRSA